MITAEEFLGLFPFFKSAPQLISSLLAAGQRRNLSAGSRMYTEGDPCQGIAFVLSGDIRVYKTAPSGREITLYQIEAGEICILNTSCLLAGKNYPAHAMALTEVSLLLLPADRFRALVDTHETLRRYVFEMFSQRLAGVMELVEEVAFGRMDERLQDYLVEKSEASVLETTHQKIANDLGTSREVVSRLLKDFERRGWVALSRNAIQLRKLP